MTADKLVSVIIPVYNAAVHLQKTLAAIIAQDYDNIEIIIVDDAYTDSSLEIAQKVLLESARPHRIISLSQNLGVSCARNFGLMAANGDFVWFCDADDLPDANFLNIMCSEALHKNSDLVFCAFSHYFEDNGTFVDMKIFADNFSSPQEYFKAWANGKIYLLSAWNFIFRRDFLRENNLLFFEGCIYGEDSEFVIKAIASASKISFVRDILYTYVHHKNQTILRRKEYSMMHSLWLARFRMLRVVLRKAKDRCVIHYVLSFCIPDMLVDKLTACAKLGYRNYYFRSLKHSKVRNLLSASVRVIAQKPELFFKAIALLYAPKLYYLLRKEK